VSLAPLVPIFVASLLGSVHCLGMCGSLVALAAGTARRGQLLRAQGAYHGVRLVAYVLWGVLAGAAGSALDLAGSALGFGRAAAVLAGVLMALWGARTLLRLWRPQVGGPLLRLGAPRAGGASRLTTRLLAKVNERSDVARGALLGLLSALLPCGWLYAFVLGAAATASPWFGGLVMATFWSGTVPLLLGWGWGIERLLGPVRRHLPALTALGLILAGGATVFARGGVPVERLEGLRAAPVVAPAAVDPNAPAADRPQGTGESSTAEPRDSAAPHGAGCPFHAAPDGEESGS
jgi:sulfite exporter TauE/SafE